MNMKKIFSYVGIAVGLAVVIMGFVVLGLETGNTYIESASFGGDFYTYSYSATRIAAQNVGYLAEIVGKGIAFLLIAIGATDICVFGFKLADVMKEQTVTAEKAPADGKEVSEEKAEVLPEI